MDIQPERSDMAPAEATRHEVAGLDALREMRTLDVRARLKEGRPPREEEEWQQGGGWWRRHLRLAADLGPQTSDPLGMAVRNLVDAILGEAMAPGPAGPDLMGEALRGSLSSLDDPRAPVGLVGIALRSWRAEPDCFWRVVAQDWYQAAEQHGAASEELRALARDLWLTPDYANDGEAVRRWGVVRDVSERARTGSCPADGARAAEDAQGAASSAHVLVPPDVTRFLRHLLKDTAPRSHEEYAELMGSRKESVGAAIRAALDAGFLKVGGPSRRKERVVYIVTPAGRRHVDTQPLRRTKAGPMRD